MKIVLAVLLLFSGPCAAQTITPQTFGQNFNSMTTYNPRISSSILRMWDETYNGAGVHWQDIETARGVYNWTAFDAILALEQSSGADVIYAFGQVPGWANGNAGAGTPPTSFQDLYDFVSAVITRSNGRIKYFEAWNEPDQPITWNGTQAQIITIAQNVFSIVHAQAPGSLVLSPSFDLLPVSVDSYYAAGLGFYTDINVVHVYPQMGPTALPATIAPEQNAVVIDQVISALNFYGQSGKPIFVDEGGGGTSITSSPVALQNAWSAIWPLQMASAGITRNLWYAYNSPFNIGTLNGSNGTGSRLNSQGSAFREAVKWLTGATFTSKIARVPSTNQIRNPNPTGVVLGTPGTAPTNWSVYNPDTGHGITTQFVACVGAGSGVCLRVFGTPTIGASGSVLLNMEGQAQIAASLGQFWTVGANIQLNAGSLANTTVFLQFVDDSSGGNYLGTDLAFPLNPTGAPLLTDTVYYTAPTSQSSVAFVQPYIAVTYTVGQVFDVTLQIGSAFMDAGTLWSGTITKPGSYQGQIIWDSAGGPTSFTASSTYTFQRNGAGQSSPIVANTLKLTGQPILLENQRWSGWTP